MRGESTSLEGLMSDYCDGDPAAFRTLYDLTAPRLLGYLKKLCGNDAAAQDLLQLTYLKLHRSRERYVRGADPLPWLFTIAQRAFLDSHRRNRRSRLEYAGDDRPLPEIAAGLLGGRMEDEPQEDGRGELTEAMKIALGRLPENQRTAVTLTKLEGRSVAEAASILGTTSGAVKLRAHRAYETLRSLLSRSNAGSDSAVFGSRDGDSASP